MSGLFISLPVYVIAVPRDNGRIAVRAWQRPDGKYDAVLYTDRILAEVEQEELVRDGVICEIVARSEFLRLCRELHPQFSHFVVDPWTLERGRYRISIDEMLDDDRQGTRVTTGRKREMATN